MKIKGLIVFVAISFAAVAAAETWRLTEGQTWQPVSQTGDSGKITTISQAKQLVSTGKTSRAKKAFAKLKANYPEFAGKDFDAFVKAELLLSKRKWEKAAFAYEKVTNDFPQSPLFDSAIERQYQIATAFLNGQKKPVLGVFKVKAYDEGSEIMTKIADRMGDAPIAKNALTSVATSREKRGAYNEAYDAWAAVNDKWPTGQEGKDSLLGMARSLDLDYKGPKFDSKVVESSRSYYAEYQKRYPEPAAELKVSEKLVVLTDKLAEKELAVADYYTRTGSDTSAELYYQRIIKDWPGSERAAQAEVKLAALQKEMAKKAMAKLSGKKKFNWKGLFL
ncbi:MAG: outer membrane protein assembly factor BamD [Phycisphaerae bacterium]|jgi:outer membrane protein assembly factor BamD (BamD/ComL family)